MAPARTKVTKQTVVSSSMAAPTAIDAKASCHSRVRPVGGMSESQARSKKTTQFDPIASGEEFNIQVSEDDEDDETSDTSSPLKTSSKLDSQGTSLQRTDTLHGPARATAAVDLILFFSGVDNKTRRKFIAEEEEEKPSAKICKLCSAKYGSDKAKIPKNVPNFIYGPRTGNTNLRRHLHTEHAAEYDDAVKKHSWRYKLTSELNDASTHDASNGRHLKSVPFSPVTFLDHLVRFIVADDQSIRVVECPEFRQLCMVLRGTLLDVDIPRRDKIREAIISQWRVSFEQLKSDLSKSCGRVSFTADVWSNANLESYLALTAHWISCDESSARLTLNAALIGFHRLKNKHSGFNIAKNILYMLDRADVTLKIGHFTLDNAENNNTAMDKLKDLLAEREIAPTVDFDPLNHRIRCYAHIINICSSHVIASVSSVSKSYLSQLKVHDDSNVTRCDDSDDESDDGDIGPDQNIDELELDSSYDDRGDTKLKEWFTGIKRDPLRRARRLIRLLRSSDQRREGFRTFIKDGNERKWFFARTEGGKRESVEVPNLELLRDVKTRWDSVYMMLQRLRDLRPAIDRYLDTEMPDFSDWKLSELDWHILEGLETVLSYPHACQQSMSSESTPVLSRAISSFEMFMTEWENLGVQHQVLRPWTEIGLRWAKKYYSRMDDTEAYIITMFLNPAIRFTWIEAEWDDDYIQQAKGAILSLMRQYRNRKPLTSEVTTGSPVQPAPIAIVRPASTRFKVQDSVYKKKLTHNPCSVEAEFRMYVSSSISSVQTDILRFWEANKKEFPTLFSIAMDYLPVQATSVPCERVFSSAKDTDTAKRNRISPDLMEALQMLKYSLKKERLNFMDGWVTSEAAMSAVSMPNGLNSLFVDDPDSALDKLLNDFHNYDH